jgi:hypothetical protein
LVYHLLDAPLELLQITFADFGCTSLCSISSLVDWS